MPAYHSVGCVDLLLFFVVPPCTSSFTGLGISQPSVVLSGLPFVDSCRPADLLLMRHLEILYSKIMHRKKIFSTLLFHRSPLVLLPVKCTPLFYHRWCLLKCTPQSQVFLSVHPGRIMLEDLPYELFRRAENCFLPSPVLLCLHQPLLDWPPLSANNPHLSPEGTPGVAQSDSRYAEPRARPPFTRTVRAVSRAKHCSQANTSLSVSFRINARKPEQEHNSCRPRLRRLGLARADCDEKQAGTVTGSQVYYIMTLFWAWVCCNVAECVVTFCN